MTDRSTVAGMTQRPTHDEPEYLTIAEAAKVLRVSQRTLQRYVADGKVNTRRTPGGHPRFRREDIEKLLLVDTDATGVGA